MTRNQDLNVLHVDDAAAFVNGLLWRVITGDTLLFDFVYFLHPARTSSVSLTPVYTHRPWSHAGRHELHASNRRDITAKHAACSP